MPRKSNGEGTICQRSDGRFEASIRIDGKRVSVYAKTEKDVKAKLAMLKTKAAKDGGVASGETLHDAFTQWLALGEWRPRTRWNYEQQSALVLDGLGAT